MYKFYIYVSYICSILQHVGYFAIIRDNIKIMGRFKSPLRK
jgi:hypothetical protein